MVKLPGPTNTPSIVQHEVMIKTPFEPENTWSIHKRSKFKKPTATIKERLPVDRIRMYNVTQTLNGRVPPDVREACRDMLYYLRKRPELLKKPSPRGFKVSLLLHTFQFLFCLLNFHGFGHRHIIYSQSF